MPDPSFIFAQSLSGLTAAMFLFLIASGLSLIFGVLRVLNFAHGSFYMLGAYGAYQFVQWFGTGPGRFWWAAIGAALGVALLGGIVERLLFRHLYAKEELYQLLFTYALVLILSDAAKLLWGTQQLSVSRPPGLERLLHALRHDGPVLQPVHPAPRPRDRARLLVRPPPDSGRPPDPRCRARSRDARRPRRQRRTGSTPACS